MTNLSTTYTMNPILLDRIVKPKDIILLNESIEQQLHEAKFRVRKYKLYIDNYGTSSDDLTEEITFCLNDWRNCNYTLFWTVKVDLSDIMEFIEDNYNLEVLESTAGDWFNDNEKDVCEAYLQSKDLETLNFV